MSGDLCLLFRSTMSSSWRWLGGRPSAVICRLYPPGISVIVPGERFDPSHAIDYLQTFAGCADAFGGFESEMQGVAAGTDLDGQSYHGVYCVKGV